MNKESCSSLRDLPVARSISTRQSKKDEKSEHNVSSNTSITEDEFSHRFGQYLNNEYELLLRTLSFLMVNDLLSCARVSKGWLNVSLKILRRRKKLNWYVKPREKDASRHDLKFEIDSTSQFVLGIQSWSKKNFVLNELIQDKSFYLSSDLQPMLAEGPSIPGLQGKNMLILQCYGTISPFCCNDEIKYLDHAAAGIFFPCVDGFHMDVKIISCDEVSLPISDDSLKGILIFYKKVSEYTILNHIERFLGTAIYPLALGGGMMNYMYEPELPYMWNDRDIITISLRGENVTCYSDILTHTDSVQVEKFFAELKENLGSYDVKKQQRIAIVIRCVGREKSKKELKLYKKYFPNVPAFTILSGGEIGHPTNLSQSDSFSIKKSRRIPEIIYRFCVVYFFITINTF